MALKLRLRQILAPQATLVTGRRLCTLGKAIVSEKPLRITLAPSFASAKLCLSSSSCSVSCGSPLISLWSATAWDMGETSSSGGNRTSTSGVVPCSADGNSSD